MNSWQRANSDVPTLISTVLLQALQVLALFLILMTWLLADSSMHRSDMRQAAHKKAWIWPPLIPHIKRIFLQFFSQHSGQSGPAKMWLSTHWLISFCFCCFKNTLSYPATPFIDDPFLSFPLQQDTWEICLYMLSPISLLSFFLEPIPSTFYPQHPTKTAFQTIASNFYIINPMVKSQSSINLT